MAKIVARTKVSLRIIASPKYDIRRPAGPMVIYETDKGQIIRVETLSQMEIVPKPFVINPTDVTLNIARHRNQP